MDSQKPIISISGASDQYSKNDTANFMHDPSTRLFAKPSTSAQESEGKHRRKVSLMPPVTEEDLWSSGMGRNDPEIVAQVFGEQFASKFRSHNISPIFEFTSYDISNPISSSTLCDPTSDLPIGLRDSNLPSGVPTVKVRVRRTSTETPNQILNAYEDVAVALSPVTPQSNTKTSPLSHENLNSLARIKGLVSQSQSNNTSSFNDLHIDNDLEIGAANPDIVHFQRVLNSWIKSQTKALGVAFILISSETNSLFCQVCGEELLEEAIQCGDSSLLLSFFEGQKLSASNRNEFGRKPSSEPETKPVVKDLKDLSTTFAKSLYEIAGRLTDQELACTNEKDRLPDASLIAIRAHCGFCTGLLVVHRSGATKNDELGAILPHLPMIGTLMSIVANIEEQKRLARQSQIFLSMAQNVFSSLQDMNLLVRNITKEAKTLVQAEICSLFLLDKEHSELVAEVFEKNGTSDEYLTEIRMPLNQGIVGHVATTGQMMNVKNVYDHPNFYPKVDQRTGFVTRNILCFPIKDSSGNLVGVAELCNKIGKPSFTKHDEQIAATFAVYCAISISHCLLYRKLQEAHRRSHMAAELLVQGSTLSIAPEDILRLTVRDIPSPTSFHPEFTTFQFVPRSIGTGDTYVEASLSMFKELGFIDRYRLRRRTLARFLLMVQKGYRDVPYHNWGHAFSVGHFCYLILRMPDVVNALSELERFSLLVASLCHDIDHRGTTNAFQLQSKTPLAQLYSSEGSVLERHHFAQTVTILGMDECNIFEQLTRQQYQTVLDNIREIILATDIAAHLRKVTRIKEMIEEGFDPSLPDHHYLFMCLLMTASDLSDQSKDFKTSKAIAENIYKEFFSQGDLEKQMGNSPIEMMDRERACVPKIQLEFMDTVALPVFDYLSRILPDLRTTYDSLLTNRRCWSALDSILQEEGLPAAGGLDYLRDAELEHDVLARIEGKPTEVRNASPSEAVSTPKKAKKPNDSDNDSNKQPR